MKDLGDKVDESEKSAVNEKIEEVKKALEADNVEDIKQKTEDLTQEVYKMSQKLYEQTGGEEAGGSSAQDDVVDADYEVVDDEEN